MPLTHCAPAIGASPTQALGVGIGDAGRDVRGIAEGAGEGGVGESTEAVGSGMLVAGAGVSVLCGRGSTSTVADTVIPSLHYDRQ